MQKIAPLLSQSGGAFCFLIASIPNSPGRLFLPPGSNISYLPEIAKIVQRVSYPVGPPTVLADGSACLPDSSVPTWSAIQHERAASACRSSGHDGGYRLHVRHSRHRVSLNLGLEVSHLVIAPRRVRSRGHYHSGVSHTRELVHSDVGCGANRVEFGLLLGGQVAHVFELAYPIYGSADCGIDEDSVLCDALEICPVCMYLTRPGLCGLRG